MNWGAIEFYVATVLVIFGVDVLAAWALNLQFGFAGVPNFGFIVFQAAGAYVASVVTLGPSTPTGYQRYVFGANLPFPVPLVLAAAAGAALAAVIGLFAVRRMRVDYQAAILLIVSLIIAQVVTADVPLFNGSLGVTGIQKPLSGLLDVSLKAYEWIFAGFVWALALVVFSLVRRLSRSGWGRALRAQRDHENAAATIGLNGTTLRMQVFVLGGAIAGLSGGLLVEYLGAWSPASWGYAETFAIFVSVIVGGVGNNWGVIIGTFLVQIVFQEVPQLLPQIGYIGLVDSLEWVIVGVLWLLCLAYRPKGLIPERRLRAPRPFDRPVRTGRPLANGLSPGPALEQSRAAGTAEATVGGER